jgi:Domain of unknown function (DUF4347)
VVATAIQVVADKAAQYHPQETHKDNIADSTPDSTIGVGDYAVFGGGLDIDSTEHKPLAFASANSVGNADAPTLYVVDSRAAGLHDLLANPPANTQIKVLDANRDGYQQIVDLLKDRGNVTNLRVLIADFGDKQWLGSTQIRSTISTTSAEALIDWGDHLTSTTQITFHRYLSIRL